MNTTAQSLAIGRLLRAGTTGFVVGVRVAQWEAPAFGGLVRVPLGDGYEIYGLIYDMHIDDDGLVRQLITAEGVDRAIIADNRENRNIPIEMSVISVGFEQGGSIYHLLPPRPPLSLDEIFLCSQVELRRFTASGRLGYFRHILRLEEVSVAEVLAAHIQQAAAAHREGGDSEWQEAAIQEVIALLRDDYASLMAVLGALGDTRLI